MIKIYPHSTSEKLIPLICRQLKGGTANLDINIYIYTTTTISVMPSNGYTHKYIRHTHRMKRSIH